MKMGTQLSQTSVKEKIQRTSLSSTMYVITIYEQVRIRMNVLEVAEVQE